MIQRWVYKFTLLVECGIKKRRMAVGTSWRMDKTYIKVKGEWLGFKSFESASRTLIGIEIVRMIKKEQIAFPRATYFKTFCSLAA
jgi:transposase-like protein